MHWLGCSLLVTALCAARGFDSAVQSETGDKPAETLTTVDPKENVINAQNAESATSESVPLEKSDPIANLTENLITGAENLTDTSNATALTTLGDGQVGWKGSQKRDVENGTLSDITPFLLFPILPFLFPPREDKASLTGRSNLPGDKNDSKLEGNPGDVKPFIFFDFAFNIRRIPLKNRTERSDAPKPVGEKNASESKSGESKENPQKNRRRRNTNTKMNTLGFFDDTPLFPDSELDEFLPKPDLFFPDLPFHHKPVKLSRRKRDQKKPDLKSDLKILMDAFDEAFLRTKKEVERTDPFLNILREAEQSFDEDGKEPEDLFGPESDTREKPSMKWRIQRNIKRLKNDHHDDLAKAQESPMIIVDKVVKIGEFHVQDEERDSKNKSKKKKKKREGKDSKNVFLGGDDHDEITPNDDIEIVPKNILELLTQEESKKKKRSHHVGQPYASVQSKEIRVLPQTNTSVFAVGANATIELKTKDGDGEPAPGNKSSKAIKYGNLLKVVDSLKSKIKVELENTAGMSPAADRPRLRGPGHEKTRKRSYDYLKKNVTELIEQFLAVVKEFDDAQLMERLEVSERDDGGMFDWTEKETLQNSDTYFLRKDPRGRRQKKNAEIEKEFVDLGKERQVNLNYLFLTVTLPTVFVFALVLLVCFFNLQIKGKICTKLFRPRQIFLVEDEAPSQFVCKNPPGAKKIQNI